MSLKHKLDTLDGLDEALKPLYAKGADGRFTLQVDDAPATNTIAKLKADLEAATQALKEKERSEAEEKARKEREDLERKGEYEKLRAQDQETIKKEREAREALESKLRNGAIERAALEAVQSAKGIPKALLPHILPNLEATPDGDSFKVTVKGDPAKKLSDYVSSLKAEMAWGFEGTGASGSGAGQGGGTATGSKARYDELMSKKDITPSEGYELVRLGNELNATPTK